MGMYAIGILPLLHSTTTSTTMVKKIAFADDFTGIGQIQHLKEWWDDILTHGPQIGY